MSPDELLQQEMLARPRRHAEVYTQMVNEITFQ
jgi:hypothetical protein